MKKELFEAIKARLVARVPAIKTIALFNDQFNNEQKNNPFKYPVCLIEFDSFDWKSQSRGIQVGTLNVRFHLGVETYKTNLSSGRTDQPNDLEFFDLIAAVHVAVNMFDAYFFTPLLRVSETQDTNHDNILVWVAEYKTQITDDNAEKIQAKQLVNFIPDETNALTLNINFPNVLVDDVELVGCWWWFAGSNPTVVHLYWRFNLLDVDPDVLVSVQYNNGNGWITVASALRSTFTDGDGINNQSISHATTMTQIDPPTVNARVVLNGIGHSNELIILQD